MTRQIRREINRYLSNGKLPLSFGFALGETDDLTDAVEDAESAENGDRTIYVAHRDLETRGGLLHGLVDQIDAEFDKKYVKAAEDYLYDYSDDALTELARDGFDPQYGARPLRRSIQNLVEDAVAEQMLEGRLRSGGTAHVRLKDGKVVIESESAPADAPQPEAAPAK